jgi:hypothetical protein
MHAYIMHDYVMHAHAVHCLLYVRIDSNMPTVAKHPTWFNSGMLIQMFQDQSYSDNWHVAKNEQRHAPYRQRVIQTIGMSLNK